MSRYRIGQHVGRHRKKYGWGVVAVLFVVVQMVWDVGANDLADYTKPLFIALLGPAP